jgi:hypothetical protein
MASRTILISGTRSVFGRAARQLGPHALQADLALGRFQEVDVDETLPLLEDRTIAVSETVE